MTQRAEILGAATDRYVAKSHREQRVADGVKTEAHPGWEWFHDYHWKLVHRYAGLAGVFAKATQSAVDRELLGWLK